VAEFPAVAARLRAILDPYRDRLEASELYGVDTLKRPGGGAHDFFGAVRVGKSYVSFHLMPVYAAPQLLDNISPGLRKRMQGKSCFNFKTVDEPLLQELDSLTRRSFDLFSSDAYPRAPESTRR
jgi:hypothetical protein